MSRQIKARVSVRVSLENAAELSEEEKKAIGNALTGTKIKQMAIKSLQGEPGVAPNAEILHDMIDMHHHEGPNGPVA